VCGAQRTTARRRFDPKPEHVLLTVRVERQRDIHGFVLDQALVADLTRSCRKRPRDRPDRAAGSAILAPRLMRSGGRPYRRFRQPLQSNTHWLLANYARPCFSGRRTDGFSATRRGRAFSLLQAPIQERTCKHLQPRCLWQQNAILRLSKPFDKESMGPALLLPDETRIVISPNRPQRSLDCPGFFFMAV
jgi:hypothetical protein